MRRLSTYLAALIRPDGLISEGFATWIHRRKRSVLLETARVRRKEIRTYVFVDPVHVLEVRALDKVEAALRDVERAVADGFFAAGYISYEAGYAFEPSITDPLPQRGPLLWFGVYRGPWIYNHKLRAVEADLKVIREAVELLRGGRRDGPAGPTHSAGTIDPVKIAPTLDEEEYRTHLAAIKSYIAEGDTYQVNFTFKLTFPFRGFPAALYCRLRETQRAPYAALVHDGERSIVSLSPELFFRQEGRRLTLRPMKGTAPRGRTNAEDEAHRQALMRSEKERAENLMIVDLLRNDAGRIARFGSVRVDRFFDIERYETIHQATSTIAAEFRPDVGPAEIFRSLFPCGSVTGAPKIRTMQIIRELEREPRGVYTGGIGFLAPRRRAVFSVAIRTVVLDSRKGMGEMGIGSGVVADSDVRKEYEECLMKARFLTERGEDFRLLETIRWDRRGGWLLLQEHLDRLQDSAAYFGFRFRRPEVLRRLAECEAALRRSNASVHAFRVRLTMGPEGDLEIGTVPLDPLPPDPVVGFSPRRTDSRDRFLFHKTTRRPLYEDDLHRAVRKGWFDVLFFNEKGELTEGARSTAVIRSGSRYATPPLSSGVLPGTFRRSLLERGIVPVEEKVLRREDLLSADALFVCNALRGLVRVKLIDETL